MERLIELPEKLDQWTYDTVVAIVRKYEFEPGSFDYKGALVLPRTDPKREEVYASIRRTVCSMANADGGFILFGVRDRSETVSSPDDRIIGISLGGDLRKQFSEKISAIQRPVDFDASPTPIICRTNLNLGIFVVYIPQSQLRPHMDLPTGAFYRRGEGGKADKMNFYEVRDQMLYTEGRLQQVRLLRLKIAQIKMLREMKVAPGAEWKRVLARSSPYDTSSLEVVLADVCDLIPTGLLENLVKLSRTANDFNIIMNPNNPFTHNDRNTAEAEKSNLLGQLCTKCEEQLAELFGPLTTDQT